MSFEMPMMASSMENPKNMEENLEKINAAAFKLKEKYGEYEEMKSFIDYLAGMERIFVLAKMEKWGSGEAKKAFLDVEIYLTAMDSGIEEDIFNNIKDDFQSAYQAVDLIRSAADKLIAEYSQCRSCVSFIEYMRDSLILLSDISNVNIGEKAEKILRARMLLVGEPDSIKLEKVYGEFKDMISNK